MARAALLVGLALGGFFDGILLHQILQWHHLLSDVRAAAVQDMRVQLLADGLFHLLMYVISAYALVGLWRSRAALVAPGASTRLAGSALMGFGIWHVLDAVLSHWITGIHRIRGDAANPMFWDVLWAVVFGLVPVAIGWWLRQRPPPGGQGPDSPAVRRQPAAAAGPASAIALALAVGVAGPIAARPAPAGSPTLVMFKPGMEGAAAFDALAAVDARVLWADRSGGLWAVQLPAGTSAQPLARHGGWALGGVFAGWGCAGWTS